MSVAELLRSSIGLRLINKRLRYRNIVAKSYGTFSPSNFERIKHIKLLFKRSELKGTYRGALVGPLVLIVISLKFLKYFTASMSNCESCLSA